MFSITGLHRLVFDLKVNGFIWSMTIHRSGFLRGVFLVIVFCINTSLGQDPCTSYTWIKVPSASPLNPSTRNSASESDCQTLCINQGSCYGYTWLNNICYQNLNSSINFTPTNAWTYNSLIRSLSNCIQTQTCSYYWYGIMDTHGFGGVQQNSINNLNDCVSSCQQTASCVAVDFNTDDNSCWIPSPDYPTGPATGMYHFPKDCRNVTTVSTTTTTTTTTPALPTTLPGTPLMPTLSTTQSAPSSNVSSSPSSNASSVVSTSSTKTTIQVALGVGVGVGVGVPVVVVIIVLVIRAVRLKTVLSQKNRNDRTELGPVQQPSAVGQVRDSANNQYQQLNWNLDNSSGTTYDKLQLQTPSTIAV